MEPTGTEIGVSKTSRFLSDQRIVSIFRLLVYVTREFRKEDESESPAHKTVETIESHFRPFLKILYRQFLKNLKFYFTTSHLFMSDKPKVLILGGTGFIGRNLVRYLVQNNCCSLIRASDKNRPEMSWLSPAELDMYKAPPVEYIMSNLVNPQSVENAFTIDGGAQFD